MTLGSKVTARRQAKDWSRTELCKQSGLSQPTVWRIENDHKVSLESLEKLSKALGVPFDELRALC